MSEQLAEQKLAITREFDAPRQQVWRAWTDPRLVAEWWGPDGVTVAVESIELEPRTGGTFRLTMHSAAHDVDVPMDARLDEIVEGELFRFSEPKPCLDEIKSVVGIVTFADVGGGRTRLGFDVTMETTDAIRAESETGWAQSFDRLATLLKK